MKKGLVKVLVDVVVLLGILLVVDVFVGWAGEKYAKWLNKKPIKRDSALVNYKLNAATPDVAIIGSSTAICHYDPDIIHDCLMAWQGKDYDVFNMGVSNQRLTYDYYALKCLLERTTPKMVIIDVWASYLGEEGKYERYEAFRPYINMNNHIREMFETHGQNSFMMKSNMYCYNTELVYLLMAPAFRSNEKVNGFSKNKSEIAKIEKSSEKDTTCLYPLSVNEFDSMIGLIKDHNLAAFIVLSPTLRPSDTASQSYQYMKKKCEEESIPFLDYSNDEDYYQEHLFRDDVHLNYYGAEIFTRNLMRDIKEYSIN